MEYKKLYKYCPQCKSDLKADSDHYFHCTVCGFYFYVNPIPCNAAILEDSHNKILLVKRKYDPHKGYLDLPGGFISINETVEDSVRREIKEELGTKITHMKYFVSCFDRYLYKKINIYTLIMIFTGKVKPTTLQAHDDVSEWKFFDKTEIPYEMIAFPSFVTALKQYVDQHS